MADMPGASTTIAIIAKPKKKKRDIDAERFVGQDPAVTGRLARQTEAREEPIINPALSEEQETQVVSDRVERAEFIAEGLPDSAKLQVRLDRAKRGEFVNPALSDDQKQGIIDEFEALLELAREQESSVADNGDTG